ncbi:hypothetical protein B0B52_16720 [Polaromonas sp. A23]|nr:hypothetical protein B0B52_16720 [Polaromonas sp. A23]
MTRRKLLMTLVFVVVFGVCLAFAVHRMLEHSEPYELGRQAVGNKLNVAPTSVKLKRLGEIDYVEGDEHGHAYFILCAVSDKCFTVIAQKRQSLWKVVELREER